jgi:hypothetical protein
MPVVDIAQLADPDVPLAQTVAAAV